jgi:hypothetical protein
LKNLSKRLITPSVENVANKKAKMAIPKLPIISNFFLPALSIINMLTMVIIS